MRDDQQPTSLFIVQMERLKIKMKEKKYDISEEDFILDILRKLPESKEWCGTQEEDPILEETWVEVTHKKVVQRRTKKTLSKSTNEPKSSKTHTVTRGNMRDKKLARVHDYQRGKPTLIKPKAKAKHAVSNTHSTAEKNVNSKSKLHCHHVDQSTKTVYRDGVLPANCPIRGGKGLLPRESPNALGSSEASARTKMGRSSRGIWSDPWCEKPRRIGTQVGGVWRKQGPSRRHPGNGQRNRKGLERGPRDETQVGTSAFRLIGARGVHDLPRSAPQGVWSMQIDARAEGNIVLSCRSTRSSSISRQVKL